MQLAVENCLSLSILIVSGISMPNLAPDLRDYDVTEPTPTFMPVVAANSVQNLNDESNGDELTPRKKKYAKEAWPGKRPSGPMLRVK